MNHPFTRSLHWGSGLAVILMATLTAGLSFPLRAQALEQLLESLNPNSGQVQSTDTLPKPQTVPEDVSKDLSSANTADDDAARRIYLGLEAEELPNVKGLRVATVTRGSPAWKSGFQTDDRIIGINGFAINRMADMIEQLGKTQPGQAVDFLVIREGRNVELTSLLISQLMAQQLLDHADPSLNDTAWIGLTVHDLTAAFQEQFGIGTYRGAAISQVVPNSPAHRAGIRAGDAITEVDGRPIESAGDFLRWLESARPGDQVTMIIYRGISRISAQVVLASEPRPQPSRPAFQPIPPRPKNRTVNPTSPETASKVPLATEPPNGLPQERLPEPGYTQRELELQQEVERLKSELADAQAKLSETRQQLNSILKTLRE